MNTIRSYEDLQQLQQQKITIPKRRPTLTIQARPGCVSITRWSFRAIAARLFTEEEASAVLVAARAVCSKAQKILKRGGWMIYAPVSENCSTFVTSVKIER